MPDGLPIVTPETSRVDLTRILSEHGVTSGIVIHHFFAGREFAVMMDLDSAAVLANEINTAIVEELTGATRLGSDHGS